MRTHGNIQRALQIDATERVLSMRYCISRSTFWRHRESTTCWFRKSTPRKWLVAPYGQIAQRMRVCSAAVLAPNKRSWVHCAPRPARIQLLQSAHAWRFACCTLTIWQLRARESLKLQCFRSNV